VTNPSPFGPLDGFAPDARRVLDVAEAEAEGLGHDRIGTEHILLGLLDDEDAPVAQALRHAGVSRAAARHKVDEAVGTRGGDPPAQGAMPTTKRASRAVEGAMRISHQRRSDAVTSRDLLQGVLNVEGTAGQVLRGLGIDVDRLSAIAEHLATDPTTPVASDPDQPNVRCPSCGEEIGAHLRYHLVAAQADVGAGRDAGVFSCGNCGVVLGVGPA
jgi:ATP-dependent Clp protease ATP-binding subunit ClpA